MIVSKFPFTCILIGKLLNLNSRKMNLPESKEFPHMPLSNCTKSEYEYIPFLVLDELPIKCM